MSQELNHTPDQNFEEIAKVSATALLTDEQASNDSAIGEYIENASRIDHGSRTPVWKVARCHQLKREGRSLSAIGQILGMDNRTIAAVLSRQDLLITDARNLLKANALGFAGDLMLASQEAAKRGKVEGIKSTLESLGVLEPVKGQGPQVAVQINLHGGPEPQSLVVSALSHEVVAETGANAGESDKAAYVCEGHSVTSVPASTYGDNVNITSTPSEGKP